MPILWIKVSNGLFQFLAYFMTDQEVDIMYLSKEFMKHYNFGSLVPEEGGWPPLTVRGPLSPLAGEIVGQNDHNEKLCGLQPPKKAHTKNYEKQCCLPLTLWLLCKNTVC